MDWRRERALNAMPPAPVELAELEDGPAKDAICAVRAEYGALALRNARSIRRLLRVLAVGIALLFVLGIANGVVSYLLSVDQGDSQRRNTAALCALRADVSDRAKASNDFLRDHPKGIPGVPIASIKTSITNANRTVSALDPVICPARHPSRPRRRR